MLFRPVLAAALLGGILLSASAAFAGTPAENASAAANLKPLVKKRFQQVAPKLVLGKVTCVTQKDQVTALCQAHFTLPANHINVVYSIKAVLHDVAGTLTWTTTAHSCTDTKSGKKIAC